VLNCWFSGGSDAQNVGAIPRDIVYRRNHIHRPEFWLPSEPTTRTGAQPTDPWFQQTGPWIIDISADGLTATFKSTTPSWLPSFGGSGNSPAESCCYGGYLYDPATGVSRQIVQSVPYGTMTLALAAAWPGAPKTNLPVFTCRSNLVYASGAGTTIERAQVSGATVTFLDAPLPPSVRGEADLTQAMIHQGKRAHYLYLANQIEQHDNTARQSIAYSTGLYRVPKRRKIMTIAPGRMSCTLESALPTTDWNGNTLAMTFAYHISRNDGTVRVGEGAADIAGKAIIEHKAGERVLFEGNIVENFGEYWRIHPSNQWSQWISSFTITMSGTSFTVSGGTLPGWTGGRLPTWVTGVVDLRRTNGNPWPWAALIKSPGPYLNCGRINTIAADGLSGTVVDSNLPTSGSFAAEVWNLPTPWYLDQDFTIRYNHSIGMQTLPSIHGNAINAAEIFLGQRFAYVHNLDEQLGSLVHGAPWDVTIGAACYCVQGPPFAGGTPVQLGARLPGAPYPAQDYGRNAPLQVSHNTLANPAARPASNGWLYAQPFRDLPLNLADTGSDVEISDNIVEAFRNTGARLINVARPITDGWLKAPVAIARNVCVGPGGASAVAALTDFTDNGGVAAQTQVGYTNAATGDFSLTDVYADTGTIAGDGLSLTISGTFPAAVAVGQFVRLAVAPSTPKRIISGGAGTNIVRWTGDVGNHNAASAFTVGFKGTASDGTDPGVDWAGFVAMTAGVDTLIEPDDTGPQPSSFAVHGARMALGRF